MKNIVFMVFFASVLIYITGCNETVNNGSDNGRLIIKITDDPFEMSYVESATVTVSKVEIRRAGDTIESDSQFLVLLEDTLTFDLLQLRNGISEDLINVDVPEGDYDLIRLYVDQASLTIKDQPLPFLVKVPGGQQTGIKIFLSPPLKIEGGFSSEMLLDFDLSKSFVMRGNLSHTTGINGFIFKPCIRAVDLATSGSIEGMVSDGVTMTGIENAKVTVNKDTVIATAFTDESGFYAFMGIPAGSYTVSATKEGYDSVSYTAINVNAGETAMQNFVLSTGQ